MKNIYFVQVGFDFVDSVYLPYAVGTLIAYSNKYLDNKSEYNFADIIFKREKLQSAINKIDNPYLVAFSCSVWNIEYNKALAKAVKEKYPNVIICFGGHSVSENAELLQNESYIDILMFGEGEIAFCELLKNLPKDNLKAVFNIAYRENGKTVKTDRKYYDDVSCFPSPYTSGVFEKIMADNPDTDFLCVLETNRGCPYSCAYCDWCAGHKTRFFPKEKVLSEIEWLSSNKIQYCFCADSNFGMFERDYDIALALINAKKTNGYPDVFRPCYEKNSADRVFKICQALNSVGMDKGATLAYQTLSPVVLENIGRKNLTMEHFSDLMKKYNQAGIPTYSELILGLPGETLESFSRGICRLMENGQHNSISVYHCEMLPNSDMSNPEYIKKYGIEVIKVEFNHIHSAIKKEEVQEYSYLVRSTNSMSREDWVSANLFSVCAQCFHNLGILQCFALYFHNENKQSYYDFYSALLRYILTSDTKLNKLWNSFKIKYESSLSGDWNYFNDDFGNVTWFFEEGAFLEIVKDFDEYTDELKPFIYSLDIDKDMADEIFRYQKMIIRKPVNDNKTIKVKYNFKDYFNGIIKSQPVSLKCGSYSYKIIPDTEFTSFEEYAKATVWYGRRRGRALYTQNEIISGE